MVFMTKLFDRYVILPNDDDDKIQNIPWIPQVGARVKQKTICNYFQCRFNCENRHKEILCLFLKRQIVGRCELAFCGPRKRVGGGLPKNRRGGSTGRRGRLYLGKDENCKLKIVWLPQSTSL